MKGKILTAVSLTILFVFMANSHAYSITSPSLDNFQSLYNFYQNGSWGQWGQIYDSELTLEWIREQIESVLDQLEEMGFTLPAEVDFYLKEVFQNAFDKLIEGRVLIPRFNSDIFDTPDYNLSWNYDVMTRKMDFEADNLFSTENMNVLVDFGGDFCSDEAAPWNLDFSIQSTSFNQDKGYFNQEDNSSRRGILRRRRENYYQTTRATSRASQLGQFCWEFIFEGQICQDGLVFLHLNPRQTTTLSIRNFTYTTKSGIEIFQDTDSQDSKFYLDIMQDNGIGGARQLYYWETPL